MKFNNEEVESKIIKEIEETGAPFLRFFTDEGRFLWDATVEFEGERKVVKIYQVVHKREPHPIVARTAAEVKEVEKNFGMEFGFLSVWNPMRISPK